MNLNEFGVWGLQQGQVANPPPNNKYAGECVSLIQQYLYRVFNMPFKAYGNAKDFEYNVPEGFTKLTVDNQLQRGDILVYGADYGGGYGHIGLIDINNKWYDQNGVKSLHIGYKDTPFNGYRCILRPENQDVLGLNNSNEEFTVRVDKEEANVRAEPNVSASLSGSKKLYKGDTFIAIGTTIGENVNGNNVWYHSKKGNYVWSGGLNRI